MDSVKYNQKKTEENNNREHYTVEYIESLPEDERYELIDGKLYAMATPTTTHQWILGNIFYTLFNYIKEKGGDCKAFCAPFAVYLNDYEDIYLEPDIVVVCDPNKIDEKGCHGAPDLVIEIASPSTQDKDYRIKLFKYRSAGVREYWVINPMTRTTMVYVFDEALEGSAAQYRFEDEIAFAMYPEVRVRVADYDGIQ